MNKWYASACQCAETKNREDNERTHNLVFVCVKLNRHYKYEWNGNAVYTINGNKVGQTYGIMNEHGV